MDNCRVLKTKPNEARGSFTKEDVAAETFSSTFWKEKELYLPMREKQNSRLFHLE